MKFREFDKNDFSIRNHRKDTIYMKCKTCISTVKIVNREIIWNKRHSAQCSTKKKRLLLNLLKHPSEIVIKIEDELIIEEKSITDFELKENNLITYTNSNLDLGKFFNNSGVAKGLFVDNEQMGIIAYITIIFKGINLFQIVAFSAKYTLDFSNYFQNFVRPVCIFINPIYIKLFEKAGFKQCSAFGLLTYIGNKNSGIFMQYGLDDQMQLLMSKKPTPVEILEYIKTKEELMNYFVTITNNSGGNCLYSAIISSLGDKPTVNKIKNLRKIVADNTGLVSKKYLEYYINQKKLSNIEDYKAKAKMSGFWGGILEIKIIANYYKIQIILLEFEGNSFVTTTHGDDLNNQIYLLWEENHFSAIKPKEIISL